MREEQKLLENLKEVVFKAYKTGLFEKRDKNKLTFLWRAVLRYLKDHSGASQVELARYLSTTPPAMTHIIDSLEKQGYVKRTAIPNNRRTHGIVLTDKGKSIIGVMDSNPIKVVEQLFEKCTKAEQEAISKGLELLLQKLTEF